MKRTFSTFYFGIVVLALSAPLYLFATVEALVLGLFGMLVWFLSELSLLRYEIDSLRRIRR